MDTHVFSFLLPLCHCPIPSLFPPSLYLHLLYHPSPTLSSSTSYSKLVQKGMEKAELIIKVSYPSSHDCLSASSSACLPVHGPCLYTYLSASACLPVCLLACLPNCQPLSVCLSAYLSGCLPLPPITPPLPVCFLFICILLPKCLPCHVLIPAPNITVYFIICFLPFSLELHMYVLSALIPFECTVGVLPLPPLLPPSHLPLFLSLPPPSHRPSPLFLSLPPTLSPPSSLPPSFFRW